MGETEQMGAALRREWHVTRAVLIGAGVVAVAVGLYLGIAARQRIVAARAIVAERVAAERKAEADKEGVTKAFCPAALTQAKSLGLLPAYASLPLPGPRGTNYKGRYLCVVATPASLYGLFADLRCFNVKEAACISLFLITQKGGAVIFARDPPPKAAKK